MTEKKPLKVIFDPGCFNNFEGTQAELDAFVVQIQAFAESDLLFENSVELTDEDIAKVTATYHAWRGEPEAGDYADVAGYCASVKLEDIGKNGYVLTAGRYVGAEDIEDTDEDFAIAMATLTERLSQQLTEGLELDRLIKQNLQGLGYDV